MKCLRCGSYMIHQRDEKSGEETVEVWQCPSCSKISLQPNNSKWVKFNEKSSFFEE